MLSGTDNFRMMMYSPIVMGLCHLVASICLEQGEKDVAKKQLVSSHPILLSDTVEVLI